MQVLSAYLWTWYKRETYDLPIISWLPHDLNDGEFPQLLMSASEFKCDLWRRYPPDTCQHIQAVSMRILLETAIAGRNMSQIKSPFAHKFTSKMPEMRIIQTEWSGVEWSVRGMEMGFGMGMGLGMGTGNWTPDADKSLGCRRLSAPAGPRS